jgi:cation:H+ antiporter
MTYFLIPIGFVLLFFGGDALVRGAVGLARHLGVSPMLIGATIVAYGTTAPELFVSLDAAFKDAPGIAIGNVVGSNICNFLLILGTSALVWPISLERASSLYLTSTILFGSTMLLLLVAWDGNIERWQGGLMVGLLVSLTVYNFRVERRRPAGQDIFTEEAQEFTDKAPQTIPKAVMVILIGLVGVVFGADFLVKGAVALARDAGIPQEVIGLTIVALGTSLPELATALIAAWRKHSDVALGTVFGANIYNILGIMGVVAAVTPVPIPSQMLRFDLWFLLAITFMLGAWIRLLPQITRYSGCGFLALYISYIVWQYLGP